MTDETVAPGAGNYEDRTSGEAQHWDSYIARRLLAGEIPGSIDFRLFFSQFAMRLGSVPPCLGPIEITFRRRQMRQLLLEAVPRPGVKVLDLGCGAGWLSLELARRGAHVTAIDISPCNLALGRYAVETNRTNYPYLYPLLAGIPCELDAFGSVTHVREDLNTVELPRHEFDRVVVWDSLHHVSDLERLLEQVRSTLKPGGSFIGIDHIEIGPRGVKFMNEITPLLHDAFGWIADHDPVWLYRTFNEMCSALEWGDMNLDPPFDPIPGSEAFIEKVRTDMLDIVGRWTDLSKLPRLEALEFVDAHEPQSSPFEDVCTHRLAKVLLESFKVDRFETVCPILLEPGLIPEPRGGRVCQVVEKLERVIM